MIKPAFCIFCGLCILTSFSLLTVNVRGVSNKHCLLPFFHLVKMRFEGFKKKINNALYFCNSKVKNAIFFPNIDSINKYLKVGKIFFCK